MNLFYTMTTYELAEGIFEQIDWHPSLQKANEYSASIVKMVAHVTNIDTYQVAFPASSITKIS